MRRRTVVLGALVAGAIVLATAGRTWVTATGLDGGVSAQARATGRDAAPVGTAMALVVMAAGLALTTARRVGIWIVGAVLALAGVVIASTSTTAALDPAATAASAVAEVTGTTAPAASYVVSVWPWVGVAGGVLALLLGLAALVAGRGWASSRRYEAPAAPGDADAEAAPDGRVRRGRTAAGGVPSADTVDEMDAWDELSRGNDPT